MLQPLFYVPFVMNSEYAQDARRACHVHAPTTQMRRSAATDSN